MNFRLLCMLAYIVTGLFGLAFLLAPEATGALYGIAGWNPGTTGMARYFGTGLLFTAAAAYAVRPTTDQALQRRFAGVSSAASVIGTLLSVQQVLTGAANALGWSTVVIYAFFAVAWFYVSRRTA